jgi:site-specific DNA-methyltransferase (adenine-specific)
VRLHGLARTKLVLDPFVGLGSTAVACAKLGIDFIGIDLDEVYLDQAAARARRAGEHLPFGE